MKPTRLSKISIKWQIFAYLALFVAGTLLLLWLLQVVFLQSFYRTIKIYDLKATAGKIAANLDRVDLQSYLFSAAHPSEADITVTDLSGNVLSSSQNPGGGRGMSASLNYGSLVSQAQKSGGSLLKWLSDNGGGSDPAAPGQPGGGVSPFRGGQSNSVAYVKIVSRKSGGKAAVILTANISPVDATVLTIRTQLICVTFLMLVFALLLALLISRRISKPIIRLNNSARELARGNYGVSFDGKGYRETSELGGTLSYAAEELGKTESLRRELIANISHDLRTPLTMITGYAEVMRDLPGENTPENVQVVIDEANRLSTLVNDVLDLSKLEASTEELRIVRFNLTESIRAILGRAKKLTEPDGVTIRFLHGGDAWVDGDELRVSQVVYNLVGNAITYTGADKLVLVRQQINAGRVRIEVMDTGAGIPPEKIPFIWDRYYKVEKSHRRAAVGTGLGLSIVKTILEKHRARYGVQSTAGQGSVFWFEFEIKEPPAGGENAPV